MTPTKETSVNDFVSALEATYTDQGSYFHSGATRSVSFRVEQLEKLATAIRKWEDKILKALYLDLGKSASEAYITEVEYALVELEYAIKKLPRWARDTKVPTPILMKPGTSKIVRDPYGRVLIIGPWNYPFQLMILPMIGAISGGNTLLLKPSELAPATAQVIADMVLDTYDEKYIAVYQGGIPETTAILDMKWDHIFFTGSTHVGKIVYQAAAKHLTPVVLELGGKCPAIIDKISIWKKRLAVSYGESI